MRFTRFTFALLLTPFLCLMSAHAQVTIISDDFSSGSINVTDAGNFGSVGLGRTQSTGTWALLGGALSSTGNNERSLGYIVDVSGLAIDDRYNTLNLSFDFTSGNASESLFVHIYGYQRGGRIARDASSMVNLSGTKGNAWTFNTDRDTPLRDNFIVTNFVNGAAQGAQAQRGGASDAFEITGIAGAQSFDQNFSLSMISTGGPTHLDDYDYIALVFARRVSGVSSSMTIDNVHLTVDVSDSGSYVDIPEKRTTALLASLTCLAFVLLVRHR